MDLPEMGRIVHEHCKRTLKWEISSAAEAGFVIRGPQALQRVEVAALSQESE